MWFPSGPFGGELSEEERETSFLPAESHPTGAGRLPGHLGMAARRRKQDERQGSQHREEECADCGSWPAATGRVPSGASSSSSGENGADGLHADEARRVRKAARRTEDSLRRRGANGQRDPPRASGQAAAGPGPGAGSPGRGASQAPGAPENAPTIDAAGGGAGQDANGAGQAQGAGRSSGGQERPHRPDPGGGRPAPAAHAKGL